MELKELISDIKGLKNIYGCKEAPNDSIVFFCVR